MSILSLDDAPTDPIARLVWLGGVKEQVAKELDDAFAAAYFDARLKRQMEQAVRQGPFAMKRALAYSRRENERRGRPIRWGDRLDATSSAYYRD
jgi:hypothetical protein